MQDTPLTPEPPDLKRRHMIARLGLLGLGTYATPALISLTVAQAGDRISRSSRPSRLSRASRLSRPSRPSRLSRASRPSRPSRLARASRPGARVHGRNKDRLQRQARVSRWSRPSRG